MLDISHFSVHDLQIFSRILFVVFSLFDSVLWRVKHFNLMKSDLSVSPFVVCALGVISKKPVPNFFKENIQMTNKHVKRCSTSFARTEIEIKTMRYHFTPIIGVRQNNGPPKMSVILIPATCEYVTLDGIRSIADAINSRILWWERSLDYPHEPNAITRIPLSVRERQEGWSQKTRCDNNSRGQNDATAGFEVRQGRGPRNIGRSPEAGKG